MGLYAGAGWKRVSSYNLGHIWTILLRIKMDLFVKNVAATFHHVKSAWRTKLGVVMTSRNLRQMPPARQPNQSLTWTGTTLLFSSVPQNPGLNLYGQLRSGIFCTCLLVFQGGFVRARGPPDIGIMPGAQKFCQTGREASDRSKPSGVENNHNDDIVT